MYLLQGLNFRTAVLGRLECETRLPVFYCLIPCDVNEPHKDN